MKYRVGVLTLAALLWMAPMALAQDATGSGPVRQQAQTNWDQQADEVFGLRQGQARQFMTQDEWQEHQQKMQTMTAEERERYRQEVHQGMVERSKERGIFAPQKSGPRGPMGGSGDMGGRGSGGRRGR